MSRASENTGLKGATAAVLSLLALCWGLSAQASTPDTGSEPTTQPASKSKVKAASDNRKNGAKPTPKPLNLMEAYKLEFAFLEAEKEALGKRLASVKSQTRRAIAERQAVITRKGKALLEIRSETEKLAAELEKLGRETVDVGEQTDLVPDTVDRAWASLEKMAVEPPSTGSQNMAPVALGGRARPGAASKPAADPTGSTAEPETTPDSTSASKSIGPQLSESPTNVQGSATDRVLIRLDAAISGATAVMKRQGLVRRLPGAFFDDFGTQHQGTIVHVGGVARFGVSEAVAGALVPAGRGHFKLWRGDTAGVARALADGQVPPTLKLYLFDNVDKAFEQKVDKTVEDIVNSGGTIAWVIVGLGGLALLLLVLRALTLWLASMGGRTTLLTTSRALERGDFSAAQAASTGRSAIARVIRATLSRLDGPRQSLEDGVSEALLNEQPRIERFGTALKVIAAVAPLMGLLGTVTGMISTFDIITEFGTGDPKLLAGGISEALVTTELGLIVAIPTLLLGTLLAGRAAQIQTAIERAAVHVINVAELSGSSPSHTTAETAASETPAHGRADETTPSIMTQESAWKSTSTSPAT